MTNQPNLNDIISKATFTEKALNPYINGVRKMDIYETTDGNELWIDPETGRLIQLAPLAGQPSNYYTISPEDRLPIAELRKIARDFITSQIPDFKERLPNLCPLEDNRKRQVYFFRYDDTTPVDDSELPPFVQVGIKADGSLISLTNVLR